MIRANVRTQISPFEFDFQSQTFPSLCLLLLSPPPALFSTHPFSSVRSFPLGPPGPEQLEIVREAIYRRIHEWLSEQISATQKSWMTTNRAEQGMIDIDGNMAKRSAQQHEEMSSGHLNLAYNHWMTLPTEVQREQWQLEITRAFVRETDRRKAVEEQLGRVQQEANQLRGQVRKLGSCQWPREFALFPPDFLPLPREVIGELDGKGELMKADSSRWDYENVVTKWKRVVMHDRGMGRVGIGNSNGMEMNGNGGENEEEDLRPMKRTRMNENEGEDE